MKARFATTCPTCRNRIETGDEIDRHGSFWYCGRCAAYHQEAADRDLILTGGAPLISKAELDAWHERQAAELPGLRAKHGLVADEEGRLHEIE